MSKKAQTTEDVVQEMDLRPKHDLVEEVTETTTGKKMVKITCPIHVKINGKDYYGVNVVDPATAETIREMVDRSQRTDASINVGRNNMKYDVDAFRAGKV